MQSPSLSETFRIDPRAVASDRMLLGHLALFASVAMLRLQIASDLGFDFSTAVGLGLLLGWSYDLAAVATMMVLPTALPRLGWPRLAWLAIPLSIVLWAVSIANALHFRWFGVRLDLWVLKLHWQDFTVVGGSAANLGSTFWIFGSLVALAIAITLYARSPRRARTVAGWKLRGGLAFAVAASMVLVAICGWRLPDWTYKRRTSMVLSDQILRVWFYEETRSRFNKGAHTVWLGGIPTDSSPAEIEAATPTLAAYRDQAYLREAEAKAAVAKTSEYPLVRAFEPSDEETRRLRRELGLPETGPLHVLMFFIESWRNFELEHADIGPKILPQTRQLIAEKGVFFEQAYSASFTAGQTVRGQFSTMCSFTPNVLGAAVYIAHTATRVRCMQDLFGDNGYEPIWFNPYRSTFHSKRQFETLHGVKNFYDEDYFLSQGLTQRIGAWGLADGPVFTHGVKLLNELAREKPVFANLLTLSTHHPHTVIPEGPVPDDLLRATDNHKDYQGYLSRLRYADQVIVDFVQQIFASPMGANTLIVLMGDHSVPVRPHLELSETQRHEILYRIPLALLTRDNPSPRRLRHPVHQIDVAPTVARIAGVKGAVTWLGRGLLEAPASAWFYQGGDTLHYRVGDRSCYTLAAGMRCFDVGADDPLFTAKLGALDEHKWQTEFFRRVLRSEMFAIALNRIAPLGRGALLPVEDSQAHAAH